MKKALDMLLSVGPATITVVWLLGLLYSAHLLSETTANPAVTIEEKLRTQNNTLAIVSATSIIPAAIHSYFALLSLKRHHRCLQEHDAALTRHHENPPTYSIAIHDYSPFTNTNASHPNRTDAGRFIAFNVFSQSSFNPVAWNRPIHHCGS
jgi:hypothetical protein